MQKFILQPTVSAVNNISASAPLYLGDEKVFSFQAVFTGSDVVGTFKIQRSDDGTVFEDVPGATKSVSSSATAYLDQSSQTGVPSVASYVYVRFVWTYGSGTGNITVTGIIKQNQVYE